VTCYREKLTFVKIITTYTITISARIKNSDEKYSIKLIKLNVSQNSILYYYNITSDISYLL